MDCWFTTSHGETCHNQPGTPNYVKGEPPKFPLTSINYRYKCLKDGFARIGYPNTGDLREPGLGRLAPEGYSLTNVNEYFKQRFTQGQLIKFATIKAGDFIVIPSDEERFLVHFGIVLKTNKDLVPPYINPRPNAYYYYYNIEKGDYYECAHRVNVLWAKDEVGEFGIFSVPEIGGTWRMAFGQLPNASERLGKIAKKAGLY